MRALGNWFVRRCRETTLIEGYTLCAILGILVVILVPIWKGARPVADRTACLSNLKQIGLGFLIYAGDHNERLPQVLGWMDTLKPHLKTPEVFHCPTAQKDNSEAYGYSFNSALSQKRLDQLERPAQVPLAYDSTSLTRSAADGVSSFPAPGRHDGQNNVVFADGHASRQPRTP